MPDRGSAVPTSQIGQPTAQSEAQIASKTVLTRLGLGAPFSDASIETVDLSAPFSFRFGTEQCLGSMKELGGGPIFAPG